MSSAQLGLNAKLYIGTSYAAATIPSEPAGWVEMSNVKDVVLDLTKSTADVTTRANNGFVAVIGTLKDATLKFSSVFVDSDTTLGVLIAAFMANTQVWGQVMDKAKAVAGTTSTGLRAFFEIVGFTRNEQLTEAIMLDFSLRPAFNLSNPPIWYTLTTAP